MFGRGANSKPRATRKRRRRCAAPETLEPRLVAASDWQNAASPCDVNDDGHITPLDAFLVIGAIRNGIATQLPGLVAGESAPLFYDVTGEGELTNLDAMFVIAELRSQVPAALVPGSMTALSLGAPASDRIEARWTTTGPLTPNYLVSLAEGGTTAANSRTWVTSAMTGFVINELKANTTYTVRVSARDAQGVVSPAFTQTITTPALEGVNTYRIDRALEAGREHLASIFDPANGNLPYFYAYSISRAEAQALGDTGSRGPNPGFEFERHLTSNASGRALYALLKAQNVLGTPSNSLAITRYSALVARMLHQPINGNYGDLAPANQRLVGLIADPRSYGTQRFDIHHIYNVGAGMRGALGLATLTANPAATLGGYLESGAQQFEQAVDNFRRWYVYGGNTNGPRVYNWEAFRAHFGLAGGNTFNSNVAADLQSSWAGMYKGWADPFLVYTLVKHYEATGHAPSLALAQDLRDVSFYNRFPNNPAQVPAGSWGHMFEPMAEMNAFGRLALVLGDADMMDRVRVRYEYIKANIASDTGWVPETLGRNSDVGEINNTGELIETALTLAQWGWTEYYADVERFTRGHLLPAQLLDTSFISNNATAASDGQRNVATRLRGAFGFPAPYGALPTNNAYFAGGYFTDITSGGVTSLAEVHSAAYAFKNGAHYVHLLFDADHASASVVSPYPAGDKLQITTHTPGDVFVRVPEWADRSQISTALTEQRLAFEYTAGGYVRIFRPATEVTISVPLVLPTARTTEFVNGRKITTDWRGDSVVAMSSMGTPRPFFRQPA